jgi:hypothetical protein
MRRSACLTVALAVLVSLTVASAGSAGATLDKGGAYVPAARGDAPGDSQADERSEKANKKNQKQEPENCPQDLWVIAIPIEGLACVLLLPKPLEDGGAEDGERGRQRGEGSEGTERLLQ